MVKYRRPLSPLRGTGSALPLNLYSTLTFCRRNSQKRMKRKNDLLKGKTWLDSIRITDIFKTNFFINTIGKGKITRALEYISPIVNQWYIKKVTFVDNCETVFYFGSNEFMMTSFLRNLYRRKKRCGIKAG